MSQNKNISKWHAKRIDVREAFLELIRPRDKEKWQHLNTQEGKAGGKLYKGFFKLLKSPNFEQLTLGCNFYNR